MKPDREVRRRIVLLSAQAFAMGLTLAWITIPGNAIFLERFGPELLPVTYIGAAAAGAVASVLLGRAFRRRPLAAVAVRLLVLTVASLTAAWAVMVADGTWLSFAVLVLLPIILPIGFMFVVGQASLLVDVRVMKAMYAKVIAGFALGFAVGGLAGAPLLELLGGTEQLFVAAAFAAAALLVLVVVTMRRFPAELSVVDHDEEVTDEVVPPSPLTRRFILLIMAFQVLSAIESQWLDYLMYDRAAARYPDERDLAEFVGRFSAITYGADILFLLVVAGALLRRYGLRLGLVANPGWVLTMVLSVLVATAAQGSGATLVFVLVVATRVSDLVLSDGTSRTSLSAAYQAIGAPHRLAAQARVESLGVPLAIGASGAVLLVVQATVGTDGPVLLFLVAPVLVAWIVCSVRIYADYRRNLLDGLRHRVLEPAELSDEDTGAVEVVERLLDSDDPRDVRLGLDAIAAASPDEMVGHLVRLAASGRDDIHEQVMARLVDADRARAAAVARAGVGHGSAVVRAVSLEVLAIAGHPADLIEVTARLDDPDPRVRRAAGSCIGAFGDDGHHHALVTTIEDHAASPDAEDRALAAGLIAACRPGAGPRGRLLGDLLLDGEPDVAVAALGSVVLAEDADHAPTVVRLLDRRGTAGAAADALVRAEGHGLAAVAHRLGEASAHSVSWLVHATRVCRRIGGSDARTVLRRIAEHPNRDVGLAALRALAPEEPPTIGPVDEAWRQELVAADLTHSARLLLAIEELDGLEAAAPLRGALVDDLQLVRRRVVTALAVRHGSRPLGQVTFQLSQPDTKVHAIALEWLDVTLAGPERRAMVLVDPGRSDAERARDLARAFSVREVGAVDLLRDIAEDRDAVWRRPWLTACAVVAAAGLAISPDTLDLDASSGPADPDGIVAETLADLARSGGVA